MPDVLGILSLSIIYGFTVCSLSCLPTLSVYLMGTGRTFTDGLVGGFYFVAGKMLVYGTWGGLAGAFGMIFGGAVGNLIDRVRFGTVTDFLDFYVGNLHWPAFNIADSAITIGIGIFLLHLLLKKMPE